MKASDDKDLVVVDSIVQPIRETCHQESPRVPKEHRGKLWTPLQGCHRATKLSEEICAQAFALLLVPAVCIFDVRGRGRTEEDRFHLSGRSS